MDKKVSGNPDCECEPGCCTPRQKPIWRRLVSLLVLAAALAIVVIKLTENRPDTTPGCCPGAGDSTSSVDSTAKIGSDTTRAASCCPKTGD